MKKIVLNEILHEIYENYIIPPNERAEYEREKSKTVRDLEIYKIPQSHTVKEYRGYGKTRHIRSGA